jgi:hypothetical protein
MAYTVVDKGSKYFDTSLYTGTGSSQSISNLNFQPDFTWIKGRSGATDHALYDNVRGVQKDLVSNATSAETTQTTGLTAFGSTGFTIGALAKLNTSSATYCSWNWLGANTTVSNTSGSITSTVSANTTSGFSIVSWTGTGANGTVGHGLGTTPAMIITKARSAFGSDAWYVVHQKSWGNDGNGLVLNNTAGIYNRVTDLAGTGITAWSSSTFTINQGSASFLNNTSIPYIGYCFAEVKGFSKFGSYIGNGNANGTFVYTGFKPAFIIIKRNEAGYDWHMHDNKRDTSNVVKNRMSPNDVYAESTNIDLMDFTSNGFKLRTTTASWNGSGATWIYMAFAESPIVSSKGIPTTAR